MLRLGSVQELGELTVKWWQWFYSTEEEPREPLFLPDVTFLSTKEMVSYDRDILTIEDKIPSNIPILFPIDKWISLGFDFTSEEELRKVAVQRIDMLLEMKATINGQSVVPRQILSPVFNLEIKRNVMKPELGNKIRKGKYKAISNGHWLYTILPSTEKSEIKSYACCKSGRLTLAVNHLCEVQK